MSTLPVAVSYLSFHGKRALSSLWLKATGHVPMDDNGRIVAADAIYKNPAAPVAQRQEAGRFMWEHLQHQIAEYSFFGHNTMRALTQPVLQDIGYKGPIGWAPADQVAPVLSERTGLTITADDFTKVREDLHRVNQALATRPPMTMYR